MIAKTGALLHRRFKAAGSYLVERMNDILAFALVAGKSPENVLKPFLEKMFKGTVRVFKLPREILRGLVETVNGEKPGMASSARRPAPPRPGL